jgi:nicotinate-nucleotide adenylyltransferase
VRYALFGGTFDPPHVGHLLVASDAFEALDLDRLLFIPAAAQPLKMGAVAAAAEARLAMTRLLAGSDSRFEVDPIEIHRDGLSFTVDTLAAFAERHPGVRPWLLVGTDVLATFHQWREPERVARLARLAVVRRATDDAGPETAAVPADAKYLTTRRVDVSSTEIRSRVRAGRSIRGFVPEAVAAYIASAGLYR